ncbi:MAG TPA: SCP2 sterol-binding domain-containing protein [Nitriliruptorales bacterium]
MSDLENVDLTAITPDEFAQLAATTGDDELTQAIHAVGTEAALTRIFQGFEERFVPERAKATSARIQFVVLDDGDQHRYQVHVHDGVCETSRGEVEDPRVMLGLGLIDFVKLVTGQAQGPMLFMGGKLKIQGDLMFASRLMNLFDAPKA